MAQKKRLRMRGVKHTSKRLEEDLLDKSRILADNPGILRPQCAGHCRKCAFDKPFKQIDGLHKIKGDPDALIKEAPTPGPYPWRRQDPSPSSPPGSWAERQSPTLCAEPSTPPS